MKIRLYYIPLLALLLQACGNEKNKPVAKTAHTVHDTTYTKYDTTHTEMERCYVGLVGERQVTLTLSYKDGNLKVADAMCYYKDDTEWHRLQHYGSRDSSILGDVVERGPRDDSRYDTIGKWVLDISEPAITGRYTANDGTTAAVTLRADSTYAMPLDRIGLEGYWQSTVDKTVYSMTTSISLLTPAATVNPAEAAFINRTLLHELGGDTIGAKSLKQYMDISNKKWLAENEADTSGADDGMNHDYSFYQTLSCRYNYDGLLVFGIYNGGYSGGAHDNHYNTYITADAKEKRMWKLADMVKADSATMSNMLNAAAIKQMNLDASQPLNDQLLVDNVPPTDNIIITERGLLFCYSPYEVASYAQGDVELLLTYDQLRPYITADFKRRMRME